MGVIGGTGSTRKCTFGFSLPPPHLMQILGRVNITVFYWWDCRLTELEMEKRLGNKGLIKFNPAVLQMLTYRPREVAWVAQGNIAWEWKGWAPCNVSCNMVLTLRQKQTLKKKQVILFCSTLTFSNPSPCTRSRLLSLFKIPLFIGSANVYWGTIVK